MLKPCLLYTSQYGIAGGFVGWNNEGLLENNNMFFADVIRGAKDLTGPFTGKSSLNSNWEFNDVKGIEGNENYYRCLLYTSRCV